MNAQLCGDANWLGSLGFEWMRNLVQMNAEVAIVDRCRSFPHKFEMYTQTTHFAARENATTQQGYFMGNPVIVVRCAVNAGGQDSLTDS